MKTAKSNLALEIAQQKVAPGTVVGWWLGGSGFVFKTEHGKRVVIDPYLSDSVGNIFGIKRAFPIPISPSDLNVDVVVCTHSHEDHLDPGTIPLLAQANPDAKFVMPPSAMSRALGWGIPRAQIIPLSATGNVEVSGFKLSHLPARHEAGIAGWEVPDAMGVLIETESLSIYHSGDTEYDIRLRLLKNRFDVGIYCINGVGGNMNGREAALLALEQGVTTAIPMHHLLWATNPGGSEATLDPGLFAETYNRLGGKGQVILPEVGRAMDFCSKESEALKL